MELSAPNLDVYWSDVVWEAWVGWRGDYVAADPSWSVYVEEWSGGEYEWMYA